MSLEFILGHNISKDFNIFTLRANRMAHFLSVFFTLLFNLPVLARQIGVSQHRGAKVLPKNLVQNPGDTIYGGKWLSIGENQEREGRFL